MKIERTSAGRARAVGVAGYARRVEAASAGPVLEPVSTSATVLGIPEAEFTPRVRDAIMTLMAEVDNLRHELEETRARLLDVERTADQDHLLPVLNRRAFVRELSRYIAFAGRYGTPASLIYFDLDGFKEINDTYGHAAGDAVLTQFAEAVKGQVRDSDVLGRLGGDEFGVILTHASQEQAARKVALVAQVLRSSPPQWQGKPIAMTFSYGAFELKAGENADSAMARADEAMYAHKRSSARR